MGPGHGLVSNGGRIKKGPFFSKDVLDGFRSDSSLLFCVSRRRQSDHRLTLVKPSEMENVT